MKTFIICFFLFSLYGCSSEVNVRKLFFEGPQISGIKFDKNQMTVRSIKKIDETGLFWIFLEDSERKKDYGILSGPNHGLEVGSVVVGICELRYNNTLFSIPDSTLVICDDYKAQPNDYI